jgi:hypothetical protein
LADNVINIADRFKKPVPKPTLEELAVTCSEEIAENWQRFAKNNRLNDYFVQSVPSWTSEGVNYLADLNAVSLIETKIKMTMSLHAPGSIDSAQLGWIADFKVGEMKVCTPFMPFEAYARCFNILLFLKLGREMTNNGIVVG